MRGNVSLKMRREDRADLEIFADDYGDWQVILSGAADEGGVAKVVIREDSLGEFRDLLEAALANLPPRRN
jgi:hypothetical protein